MKMSDDANRTGNLLGDIKCVCNSFDTSRNIFIDVTFDIRMFCACIKSQKPEQTLLSWVFTSDSKMELYPAFLLLLLACFAQVTLCRDFDKVSLICIKYWNLIPNSWTLDSLWEDVLYFIWNYRIRFSVTGFRSTDFFLKKIFWGLGRSQNRNFWKRSSCPTKLWYQSFLDPSDHPYMSKMSKI